VLCANAAPASAIAETRIAIEDFFMFTPFPKVGTTRRTNPAPLLEGGRIRSKALVHCRRLHRQAK
jgi:hypothetical protein